MLVDVYAHARAHIQYPGYGELKTPLDNWCLHFSAHKMEPLVPIWRGWKAVGKMVSHILSAVPRTQALTELASSPSHLHFTNKEAEAQEALPGHEGV